jgi:hypothetical protein
LLRQCIRSEDQTPQNLVTADSFAPEKASRATTKRVNGPKRRGQNGKSAVSASKRADLNGGFRADVVSSELSLALSGWRNLWLWNWQSVGLELTQFVPAELQRRSSPAQLDPEMPPDLFERAPEIVEPWLAGGCSQKSNMALSLATVKLGVAALRSVSMTSTAAFFPKGFAAGPNIRNKRKLNTDFERLQDAILIFSKGVTCFRW